MGCIDQIAISFAGVPLSEQPTELPAIERQQLQEALAAELVASKTAYRPADSDSASLCVVEHFKDCGIVEPAELDQWRWTPAGKLAIQVGYRIQRVGESIMSVRDISHENMTTWELFMCLHNQGFLCDVFEKYDRRHINKVLYTSGTSENSGTWRMVSCFAAII